VSTQDIFTLINNRNDNLGSGSIILGRFFINHREELDESMIEKIGEILEERL